MGIGVEKRELDDWCTKFLGNYGNKIHYCSGRIPSGTAPNV